MRIGGPINKYYDYYRQFLAELHEPVMWSDSLSSINVSKAKKINKCVTPLVMTEQKAKLEGFWWYKNLLKIFYIAEKEGLVRDIVVHGSYGDFSMTSFSDLEITIFIDESVFQDFYRKELFSFWVKKHLNKFIVRVDPIQHHGAFYIWPDLLSEYSELILPCCAYNSCWSLRGKKLEFFVNDDINFFKKESSFRLRATLEILSDPELNFFRLGFNDYSVKRYLSNLMLIPAFYYQSKGDLISKREAILRFIKEFPSGFTESLLTAGRIRERWSSQYGALGVARPLFVSERIPQGRLDLMILSVFSKNKNNKLFQIDDFWAARRNSQEFLEVLCGNC
ncbi:hypothetical protein [Marinobacter sp.]|uniref:hypothetical protein n=1 Tax=Marinobacter sp. TaxID=50741 RepID=UPI003BACF940